MKIDNDSGEKIELALTYILSISIIGTFFGIGFFAQTIIVFVVFLTLTIVCGIVIGFLRSGSSFNNSEKQNSTNQQAENNQTVVQETAQTFVRLEEQKDQKHSMDYYREHCYDSAEMYQNYFRDYRVIEEKEYMDKLLEREQHKVTRFLMTRKFDKAIEVISEALQVADPIRDANAIHWFLIQALRDFYALRAEDQVVYFYCLQICDYDLNNIENYFLFNGTTIRHQTDEQGRRLWDEPEILVYNRNPPPNLETATKKAIILEKLGYIDEAIDYCNYAIQHELPDTNGNTFFARKIRLEKKRAKIQYDQNHLF